MGNTRKITILVLIVAANFVQMISNMVGLAAGLEISKLLGAETGPGKANWIAASYPLTQGTFVLMSGRLGAVYGHKTILFIGGAWLVVWSMINGFVNSLIPFIIARAMSGIGGALLMPNVVAMIGITCPPGRLRNVSLGFFSASAPTGGYIGSIISGAFIAAGRWDLFFITLAILATLILAALWVLLPPERPVDRNGKIDWVGAILGTGGLIVFNVAWNQAPAVGWNEPYEIVLVCMSILILAIFTLWEWKFAHTPILPLDIWRAPSFLPLVLCALFCFMSNGTFLWYLVAWLEIVRDYTVLEFAISWTPFGIMGVVGALLAAWLIPRLAAQWILAIGAIAILISNLLLATMPEQQSYWVQVFPANLFMAFCPDFVYTAAQIIASNSVRRSQQGVAASLIGMLNLYGTSLGLGFSGTVESEINKGKQNPVVGYRAALYFGAALAVAALVIDVLFVRVIKDNREGWADEEDASSTGADRAEGTSSSVQHRGASIAI
ncbi:major facilitator superfamily domain-containing protein [Xylogone sp. PMI_703]|nr:major facilitator superfamily domain-containing protein [Xylogone sp. PMI_703]